MPGAAAEAAIGREDEESDWRLSPEAHARALPPEAGALRRVLERSELKHLIERFYAADAAAVAAQARYKRVGRLGLYSATLATLVGALFLLPIELTSVPYRIGSVVQIVGLVTAFVASRWLAVANPFDAWMKKRAEAELARIALFDTVAGADEATHENEIPLLPLKLEYFRRYQLDVQRRYYRGRGNQHQAAVWRNNRLLGMSLAVTIISILLGLLVAAYIAAALGLLPQQILVWSSGLGHAEVNRVILALGVIASGLYGLGVARSLMDLDERNASRYLVTAENLDFLAATRLPQAREAAASGMSDEVLAFIQRVQDLISSEHKEWTLLSGREAQPERLLRATTK